MLRKVGRKRARVPLTREGKNLAGSMLTVESVWMESGLAASYAASAIGYFGVGSAYVASRISPAIARRSSLAYVRGRSVSSRLYHGRVKKTPPPDSDSN